MAGCAASALSESHRRLWSADADRSCPPACPCGPRCVRTSVHRKARPPPHPAARSVSLPPLSGLLRPDAPGCVLHRSEPPDPTSAWIRLPDLFLLQWLAPSRSPQSPCSSCLYQPSQLQLKSNVRKKSYVIGRAGAGHRRIQGGAIKKVVSP